MWLESAISDIIRELDANCASRTFWRWCCESGNVCVWLHRIVEMSVLCGINDYPINSQWESHELVQVDRKLENNLMLLSWIVENSNLECFFFCLIYSLVLPKHMEMLLIHIRKFILALRHLENAKQKTEKKYLFDLISMLLYLNSGIRSSIFYEKNNLISMRISIPGQIMHMMSWVLNLKFGPSKWVIELIEMMNWITAINISIG